MKKLLISDLVFLIVMFIGLIGCYLFLDKNIYIKLNGDDEEISVFSDYQELGANVYYKSRLLKGKKIDNLEISGSVNTSELGTYEIYYESSYHNKKTVEKRTIKVVDNVAPIINSIDNIEACPNTNLDTLIFDYSANDNYDGDITNKVSVSTLDKNITLEVEDSSFNKTIKNINVEFKDSIAPTISLNGGNEISILNGSKYNEPGYIAHDNCDDDINSRVEVISTLDTTKDGEYLIKYKVSDNAGNITEVSRKINVYSEKFSNGGTIYLTFDDGPCSYTSKLLDILKKYNVKATFFVTSPGNYGYLIKRAYDEGHSIGLHTYSHVYKEIYSSENAYFNDLNRIRTEVYNLTGVYSNLIRFPGGSSNTVSRDVPGLMTILSTKVESMGYKYFDWNVSAGDTTNISSDQIANNVIKSLGSAKTYIVLQHDIKINSVNAVEKIINYGISHGYKFASLNETSPTSHHKIFN